MLAPETETSTTLRMLFLSDIRMTRVHEEAMKKDDEVDEDADNNNVTE